MDRCRWVIVLALLTRSVAFAQSAPEEPNSTARQEAAERFERGVELFREQAFRAALVEFQRAYDLAADYRLLYNLARARHQLQDYLGAAQDYESFLTQGGSEVPPERRAVVEDLLSALRSRVGRLSISVNRQGADVFVDDVKIGVAPLAQLVAANVGRHRVSARSSDGAVSAAFVDIAGGDIADVRIELEDVRAASTTAPITGPAASDRPWSITRKVALAGWMAGGVLLAASVGTGVYSLKATAKYSERLATVGSTRAALEEQRAKADRFSLATDVLIGVGAAAAVTGTILWLLSPERREHQANRESEKRASLRLNMGLSSLGLSGSF